MPNKAERPKRRKKDTPALLLQEGSRAKAPLGPFSAHGASSNYLGDFLKTKGGRRYRLPKLGQQGAREGRPSVVSRCLGAAQMCSECARAVVLVGESGRCDGTFVCASYHARRQVVGRLCWPRPAGPKLPPGQPLARLCIEFEL